MASNTDSGWDLRSRPLTRSHVLSGGNYVVSDLGNRKSQKSQNETSGMEVGYQNSQLSEMDENILSTDQELVENAPVSMNTPMDCELQSDRDHSVSSRDTDVGHSGSHIHGKISMLQQKCHSETELHEIGSEPVQVDILNVKDFEIQRLKGDIRELTSALSKSRYELDYTEEQLDKSKEDLQVIKQRFDGAIEDLNMTRQLLQRRENELTMAKRQISLYQKEIAETKSELNVVKGELQSRQYADKQREIPSRYQNEQNMELLHGFRQLQVLLSISTTMALVNLI